MVINSGVNVLSCIQQAPISNRVSLATFNRERPARQCVVQNTVLARDVIYTSRAYATMSVSVCLSVSL